MLVVILMICGAASYTNAQETSQTNPAPSVKPHRRPLPVPANPNLPTLFLIGDSTIRNGQGDGGGGQCG